MQECARNPYRSFGDSVDNPRVCVDLVFTGVVMRTSVEIFLCQLKRSVLTDAMVVGNKTLLTADDALILECGSPGVLRYIRALCSEVIFLSADKLLVGWS